MPNNFRPTIPTVIAFDGKPVTQERVAVKNPVVSVKDITDVKGAIDPAALVRVLGLLQATVVDATAAQRSSPLQMYCIVQNVALTSGTNANIKHSLGAVWRYATIIGAQKGAASCVLTRTTPAPATIDQSQYASVTPTGTGTYDVCIYPG